MHFLFKSIFTVTSEPAVIILESVSSRTVNTKYSIEKHY